MLQSFHVRLQLFYKVWKTWLLCNWERFLNHIVAVLIQKKIVERIRRQDLVNHRLLYFWTIVLQAFFDNVRWELLSAKLKQVFEQLLPYFLIDFYVLQLKDILYHIVAIWIFDEDKCVLSDFKHQTHLLANLSPVDALLHHTASMFVASNLNTLADHSIIDKLVELRFPCLKNLLNYMIAIYIFSKLPNSILEERRKQVYMLRLLYNLNDLLDWSCSVGMSTETNWILLHILNDLS